MKSEHSFLHRIIQAIQQGLSPKAKQQCRTCGEWYRPSQLDSKGFCRECN
ncbi:hypothetical protein HRE53_27115 (plasmid) [Acaryochloris sp. 'Moss Beach']|nr:MULTISPECIES: hypothetical protein [Acaryochloris]QUY40310.1 hypothetical protein I1H34_00390 [Acaryochloris marina S15]UJB72275.1 hypothetical protein HRE53_27115 [Acaryochloris sp. 'Moss Beach']